MGEEENQVLKWVEGLPPDVKNAVFVHPSAGGNEFSRLAFYGDSVLDVYIRRNLLKMYPDADQGELTKKRAIIASTSSLSFIAKEWGLADLLEYQEGETPSAHTLANLTEAFVAAVVVHMDPVHNPAALGEFFSFLDRFFLPYWQSFLTEFADYKSLVQDILTEQGKSFRYKVISKDGPEHQPVFTVCLMVNGQEVSRGTGHNIKEAEQAAAAAFVEISAQ